MVFLTFPTSGIIVRIRQYNYSANFSKVKKRQAYDRNNIVMDGKPTSSVAIATNFLDPSSL